MAKEGFRALAEKMKSEELKIKVAGSSAEGERSIGFLNRAFSLTDGVAQISTNMKNVASLVEVLQIEGVYLNKLPRHARRLEVSTPAC